jgi:hypothetical protein
MGEWGQRWNHEQSLEGMREREYYYTEF